VLDLRSENQMSYHVKDYATISAEASAVEKSSYSILSLNCFFENKWGTYNATIYYLEELDNRPVVIFAHGFAAWKELYTWVADSLVKQGYVTLLFTVPNMLRIRPHQWSDGFKNAIDYILGEKTLSRRVDFEKIGAMGHSMGGLGALIAASEDPRIKCVEGLAPGVLPIFLKRHKEALSVLLPVQVQIGSEDKIIYPEYVKAFYDHLVSEKKSYIQIPGGNHIQFTDKRNITVIGDSLGALAGSERHLTDGPPKISFEEQQSISRNNFSAWFDDCFR
jgi:predicted dienelactone hydrolase